MAVGASVILLALGLSVAVADKKIYVKTENGTFGVATWSSHLTGGQFQTFSVPQVGPNEPYNDREILDLRMAQTNGRLYYSFIRLHNAEPLPEAVYQSEFGYVNATTVSGQVVLRSLIGPGLPATGVKQFAIDEANSKIYSLELDLSRWFATGQLDLGTFFRVSNMDGSNLQTIAAWNWTDQPSSWTPTTVTLPDSMHLANGWIYYYDSLFRQINALKIDGTVRRTVLDLGQLNWEGRSLAIAPSIGKLFAVIRDGSNNGGSSSGDSSSGGSSSTTGTPSTAFEKFYWAPGNTTVTAQVFASADCGSEPMATVTVIASNACEMAPGDAGFHYRASISGNSITMTFYDSADCNSNQRAPPTTCTQGQCCLVTMSSGSTSSSSSSGTGPSSSSTTTTSTTSSTSTSTTTSTAAAGTTANGGSGGSTTGRAVSGGSTGVSGGSTTTTTSGAGTTASTTSGDATTTTTSGAATTASTTSGESSTGAGTTTTSTTTGVATTSTGSTGRGVQVVFEKFNWADGSTNVTAEVFGEDFICAGDPQMTTSVEADGTCHPAPYSEFFFRADLNGAVATIVFYDDSNCAGVQRAPTTTCNRGDCCELKLSGPLGTSGSGAVTTHAAAGTTGVAQQIVYEAFNWTDGSVQVTALVYGDHNDNCDGEPLQTTTVEADGVCRPAPYSDFFFLAGLKSNTYLPVTFYNDEHCTGVQRAPTTTCTRLQCCPLEISGPLGTSGSGAVTTHAAAGTTGVAQQIVYEAFNWTDGSVQVTALVYGDHNENCGGEPLQTTTVDADGLCRPAPYSDFFFLAGLKSNTYLSVSFFNDENCTGVQRAPTTTCTRLQCCPLEISGPLGSTTTGEVEQEKRHVPRHAAAPARTLAELKALLDSSSPNRRQSKRQNWSRAQLVSVPLEGGNATFVPGWLPNNMDMECIATDDVHGFLISAARTWLDNNVEFWSVYAGPYNNSIVAEVHRFPTGTSRLDQVFVDTVNPIPTPFPPVLPTTGPVVTTQVLPTTRSVTTRSASSSSSSSSSAAGTTTRAASSSSSSSATTRAASSTASSSSAGAATTRAASSGISGTTGSPQGVTVRTTIWDGSSCSTPQSANSTFTATVFAGVCREYPQQFPGAPTAYYTLTFNATNDSVRLLLYFGNSICQGGAQQGLAADHRFQNGVCSQVSIALPGFSTTQWVTNWWGSRLTTSTSTAGTVSAAAGLSASFAQAVIMVVVALLAIVF
eukprot:TRINITY_DN604_c0_g1_i4.p1 TRINITY_DN604_c0_g1~~TRINITY_DN604_c0_g1_i4.p1  ORF type:complete len:1221 (+),score=406.33 TRINITY_DN604_c0_g1_i4:101-3763(+)